MNAVCENDQCLCRPGYCGDGYIRCDREFFMCYTFVTFHCEELVCDTSSCLICQILVTKFCVNLKIYCATDCFATIYGDIEYLNVLIGDFGLGLQLWCFSATFNNISVIVAISFVGGKNHRPAVSH